MSKKTDYEYYFKCLIALNALGLHLEFRDGHTWIEYTHSESDVGFFETTLRTSGIMLNGKIYGGIFEALDTVDRALIDAGAKPLVDYFVPDFMILGDGGVDTSRIDKVEMWYGGLV